MAHGFYYHTTLKHDEIVDFRKHTGISNRHGSRFKPNYDFVWDIYNEVAKKHGIKLPKFWVAVDAYTKMDRYRRFKDDYFILEPLGPVIHVDMGYTMTGHLAGSTERGAVAYSYNWYKHAERFFMVHGTAQAALSGKNFHRHGFLCEKWRAKSMKLTLRK